MNDSTDRVLPVLVCIDDSEEMTDVAQWAAAYAAQVHAPLRLVHTVPDGDWYGSAAFVDGGAFEDELRRLGHEYLERAATAARTVAPDLCVETVSADGTIAAFVSTTRAQLVVLGSRKSSYAREIVLGSNTIRVINHAQSPVLIWRGGADPVNEQRPIVVGIDGSDQSDRALVLALETAQALGTPVIAANYWGRAAHAGVGLGAGYIDWEKVRTQLARWLRSHVAVIREKYPDVEVSTVSAEITPARGLRAISSDASIVVVGCRGRGPLRGAALGSVSQNLIHHAECSVLVVR